MATLLLAAAGSAIGGAVGGTVLGVSSAMIGQAVGATIGRAIDQRLLGGLSTSRREGQRLTGMDTMTSREGSPLPDVVGRVQIAGELIWAAKLREVVSVDRQRVKAGKSRQTVETTNYEYYGSFAVSLGVGPMVHFGRVWADGNLLDLSDMLADDRVRFYRGTETQMPDRLIVATEGAAPAYRGTAYIVFEDMDLSDYGNRIPQIRVECWGQSGEMERLVRGVNIIPGSTEWGYNPTPVRRVVRDGGDTVSEVPENAARFAGVSDWSVSMDDLSAILPRADTASLVVSWFGTDLRCGRCEVQPRVEWKDKETSPAWSAAGLTRATANPVSQIDGRPSYGSAPADASVVAAIRDLRRRGKRVVLYPFVMFDVTDAQALPDPSGNGTQGAYPWRGRLAPEAGKSATAEVAAFMGTAQPAHFTVVGGAVSYAGPTEWRYRRFILHLAALAKAAGGVDAFLIGSEMRGMTMAPSGPGDYPFVNALRTLAADVRAILGPGVKISYAADWSEYHSHRDGGAVWFHLDALWADPNINFVGIDNYLPLSDWRRGRDHLDYDPAAGHVSGYSLDYLKSQVEGGEYWDYYYADDAARIAQDRTPITDFYGSPWVFRQKAVRDWHGRSHHHRPGGVPTAFPTAWVPGSKPIWFTELGCPACDFGATRPNVFWTRHSSEANLPWGSEGLRDDFMQRQFLRAAIEWWRDNGAGVVSPADIQVWCWDARPWPEFPGAAALWSDGGDWRLGHWLNGRAGAAPAAEAIRRRLVDLHGLAPARFDLSACYGQVDGYPSAGPQPFRSWISPLEVGLGLQSHETGGRLVIEARGELPVAPPISEDGMVAGDPAPLTATRSAFEDVPSEAVVTFLDGMRDYAPAAARAVIGAGDVSGVATAEVPLVLDADLAQTSAERLLRSAADGREGVVFSAPRSAVDIRPGIVLPVEYHGRPARLMVVDRVTDGEVRRVEARHWSDVAWRLAAPVEVAARSVPVRGASGAVLRLLDLPLLPGADADEWDVWAAAHAHPWPGPVAVARSPDADGGFVASAVLRARSQIGTLSASLSPDRPHVWTAGPLELRLWSGNLAPRPDADVLAGANTLAIRHDLGPDRSEWELVQFQNAELVGAGEYRLARLLRGQRGTDHLSRRAVPPGADVVILSGAMQPLGLSEADAGHAFWARFGPARRPITEHALRAHRPARTGQRPFAVAHLAGRRSGGDLVVSWHRRTRRPVTTWPADGSEPPMGEVAEAYRVRVGPVGGAFVRSATVSGPVWTYTAAMRAADGIAGPVRVAVAQVSDTYGPGVWSEINVR